MLVEVVMQGFKSINKITYPVKELNILLGPNSSGKTAFLQAFALVKQSISGLSFNGPLVDIGNYKDAVYLHNNNNTMSFVFGIAPRNIDYSNLLFFVEIKGDRENKPHIARSGLSSNYDRLKVVEYVKDRRRKEPDGPRKDTISDLGDLVFENIGVLPRVVDGDISAQEKYIEIYESVAEEFNSYLYYLSAKRGYRERSESASAIYHRRPSDIGVVGENLIPVLVYIQSEDEYAEIMGKIRFWLSRFGISESVATLAQGVNLNYSLKVKNVDTGVQSTIADVGFGVNQLLPVIVQCFYAPKGSLILVEQPEAHLHPKLQAEVADFLVDVVNYGNRIIVETHSEHLLLRLQRRIAEKKIDPRKVNVHYFEIKNRATKASELKLNENGDFSVPVPTGFFEEGFDEVFARMKAVSSKGGSNEQKE